MIVSRGELIEIGDGFRIPDVLAHSGARLRRGRHDEPHAGGRLRGRGRPRHRAAAARPPVELPHGRLHRAAARSRELAAVAGRHGLPLVDDLGSGSLVAVRRRAARRRTSLAAGADLVCFSGDKLLGGPAGGDPRRQRRARRAAAAPPAPAGAPARQAHPGRAGGHAAALPRSRRGRSRDVPVAAQAARAAGRCSRPRRAARRTGRRSRRSRRPDAAGGGALPLASAAERRVRGRRRARSFPAASASRRSSRVVREGRTLLDCRDGRRRRGRRGRRAAVAAARRMSGARGLRPAHARHCGPHRPRQDPARRGADRHRHRPPAGGAGARESRSSSATRALELADGTAAVRDRRPRARALRADDGRRARRASTSSCSSSTRARARSRRRSSTCRSCGCSASSTGVVGCHQGRREPSPSGSTRRRRRSASCCREPRSCRSAQRPSAGLDELRRGARARGRGASARRGRRRRGAAVRRPRLQPRRAPARSSPERSGRATVARRRPAPGASGGFSARVRERRGARDGRRSRRPPASGSRSPSSADRARGRRARATRSSRPARTRSSYRLDVALDGLRARRAALRRRPSATAPRPSGAASCASASGYAQLRLSTGRSSRRAATGSCCAGSTTVGGGARPRPAPPRQAGRVRGSSCSTRRPAGAPRRARRRAGRARSAGRGGLLGDGELDGRSGSLVRAGWVCSRRVARGGASRRAARCSRPRAGELDPGLPAGDAARRRAVDERRSRRCSAWSARGGKLYLPGRRPGVDRRRAAAAALDAQLASAGLEPVRPDDAELARQLEREGRLVRLGDGLAIGADAYERARQLLVGECERGGHDHARTLPRPARNSRRVAQLLLERFDADRVTLRVGETRRLRRGARPPGRV